MERKSSPSAGAVFLDRKKRIADLREAAQRLSHQVPETVEVILFGSLAAGIPTPRSDADLLVILSASPHARPRERIPALLEALGPIPCPVDLFALTREEVDRSRGHPLLREALEKGVSLLSG